MTPINLEDVESYLLDHSDIGTATIDRMQLREWIRGRMAELRAREEAKR